MSADKKPTAGKNHRRSAGNRSARRPPVNQVEIGRVRAIVAHALRLKFNEFRFIGQVFRGTANEARTWAARGARLMREEDEEFGRRTAPGRRRGN